MWSNKKVCIPLNLYSLYSVLLTIAFSAKLSIQFYTPRTISRKQQHSYDVPDTFTHTERCGCAARNTFRRCCFFSISKWLCVHYLQLWTGWNLLTFESKCERNPKRNCKKENDEELSKEKEKRYFFIDYVGKRKGDCVCAGRKMERLNERELEHSRVEWQYIKVNSHQIDFLLVLRAIFNQCIFANLHQYVLRIPQFTFPTQKHIVIDNTYDDRKKETIYVYLFIFPFLKGTFFPISCIFSLSY